MKFIVLDCEMGGISDGVDKQTDLLTAYFQVMEAIDTGLGEEQSLFHFHLKDKLEDHLELWIKHDIYRVTPEGMTINKIDLVRHDKLAEYQSTAGQRLFKFLQLHSSNGQDKLIPLGHGINGDLTYIYDQLLGRKTWEQFCSFRKIDTGVIARFCQLQGKIPMDLDCSLESLVNHFRVDLQQYTSLPLHDAKADAIATALVFQKELAL